MPLSVELDEVLRRAQDSRIADVWTCFVAKVQAYDASTRTADLQPMISRALPDGDEGFSYEPLPVLPDVPIRFPVGSGSTYAITWPLAVGDFVDVHVQTVNHSNFRRTGQPSDPGDLRNHSLSSCYAVPGAGPNALALSQASDSALVIDGDLIKLIKGATSFVALADLVHTELNNIKTTLSSGSTAPTGGPVTFAVAYNPGSVAATKVKAK